jgi:hypothetical protein
LTMTEYRKVRDQFLREHPRCECVINDWRCRMEATQVHHKRGRGADTCNTEFFMAVCFGCHEHIEKNRKWAKEQGYLLNRVAKFRPDFRRENPQDNAGGGGKG